MLALHRLLGGFLLGLKVERSKKKHKPRIPRGEDFYIRKLNACKTANFIGVVSAFGGEQYKINCMTDICVECVECGHQWKTNYQRLMVVKNGCPRCDKIKRFGTYESKESSSNAQLDQSYVDSMVVGAIYSLKSIGIESANRRSIKQEISKNASEKIPMADIQKSMIRLSEKGVCMINGITKETIYF